MKCPVCANNMTEVNAGSVRVDVCLGGCGGIWFDNFELQKLDEPRDSAGNMLVNVKPRPDVAIDPNQRRNCPRCKSIVMMRHFYSPRRRVEVDECPSCGGFWLDAGELALIREEHANEAEQQQAVEQYIDAVSESILGPLRAGNAQETARARRLDQLFRFTRPIRFWRETTPPPGAH